MRNKRRAAPSVSPPPRGGGRRKAAALGALSSVDLNADWHGWTASTCCSWTRLRCVRRDQAETSVLFKYCQALLAQKPGGHGQHAVLEVGQGLRRCRHGSGRGGQADLKPSPATTPKLPRFVLAIEAIKA